MKERNGSPEFYRMLEEMADIHDKKSHDYANNKDPFGNYIFAGQVSSMFSHSPNDAGFVGRIAEKLYRLSNLEKDGKTPINESIEDTERDICTIVVLWMASRREKRKSQIKWPNNNKMETCSKCDKPIAPPDKWITPFGNLCEDCYKEYRKS